MQTTKNSKIKIFLLFYKNFLVKKLKPKAKSNKKSPIGTGIKKAAIIFFNTNIYSPIIADVYPTTRVLSFEISALVQ